MDKESGNWKARQGNRRAKLAVQDLPARVQDVLAELNASDGDWEEFVCEAGCERWLVVKLWEDWNHYELAAAVVEWRSGLLKA